MKILRILVLVFSLFAAGNAQDKEHLTKLEGTIIDQSGAGISSTKIILTNNAGKQFETVTNDDGMYLIKIPPGTYIIEAEYTKHHAWEKFRIEKYEIASTEKMTLDISLRINEEFTEKQSSPMTSQPVKEKKKSKA